ncbi:MAG: lipopolysaccharide heptosyltransferase II [Pseudomonadota bacterium]
MPNILIIGPSWVGDTVLAQPLFKRLHQRLGNFSIDVFAPPWTAPLLKRMPEVREVVVNPFGHGELKLYRRWQTAQQIKQRNYDQVIVLPNSFKSALIPWLAGIPLRTGYVGEKRSWLLNDVRVLDPDALPLMMERFIALAEPPGAKLPRPLPLASLPVKETTRLATLAKLNLHPAKPVAVFCPGAEYGPAKRWPAKHFAELARQLSAGYEIWLVGSNKDAAVGEEIRKLSNGACINLCGQSSLAEAVDLLASAMLVVSNDSGLMHVAAALDRTMIALYGSSSPAFTPPLSGRAHIMKLDLPCSPCFKRECPLGHFNCMNQLAPDDVLAKIRAVTGA